MKPKIYIDEVEKCLRVESDATNKITLTEIHSFIKDFISVAYDYGRKYPEVKIGNYIKE